MCKIWAALYCKRKFYPSGVSRCNSYRHRIRDLHAFLAGEGCKGGFFALSDLDAMSSPWACRRCPAEDVVVRLFEDGGGRSLGDGANTVTEGNF
jgi:hypothetical protein